MICGEPLFLETPIWSKNVLEADQADHIHDWIFCSAETSCTQQLQAKHAVRAWWHETTGSIWVAWQRHFLVQWNLKPRPHQCLQVKQSIWFYLKSSEKDKKNWSQKTPQNASAGDHCAKFPHKFSTFALKKSPTHYSRSEFQHSKTNLIPTLVHSALHIPVLTKQILNHLQLL